MQIFDWCYLVLFGSKKHDYISNRIRYLISVKSSFTHIISRYFEKIKVDWNNSLPLQKTITFHNVIILIKSTFNKDKSSYFCNIFLELASNELPKKYFLHKIKCYIMIELTFQKELILIRPASQKSAIFVTIYHCLSFTRVYAIDAMI